MTILLDDASEVVDKFLRVFYMLNQVKEADEVEFPVGEVFLVFFNCPWIDFCDA